MLAWVFRFGFFSFGNPSDGLWLILLSCVVYGMAFDFFNVSGSMFVDTTVDKKYRSSSQGIFMMMTNGFGAIFGSLVSGWMIDRFFILKFDNVNQLANYLETTKDDSFLQKMLENQNINVDSLSRLSRTVTFKDWSSIWMSFAIYSLVIAILFAVLFKHKHTPGQIEGLNH